jgi:hypothetical protein
MKLSVVIPVYNEAKTIRELVRQVLAVPVEKEIVSSTTAPRTAHATSSPSRRQGRRPRLLPAGEPGKGAAVARGFQEARETWSSFRRGPRVRPEGVPEALKPIVEGHADVVYGSRFLGGGERRVLYFGTRSAPHVDARVQHVHEPEPDGHGDLRKMFRREVIQSITIESAGSGSSRRSRRRSRAAATASTRCPSRTTGARTRRARRSLGRTPCRLSGRSSSTACARPSPANAT